MSKPERYGLHYLERFGHGNPDFYLASDIDPLLERMKVLEECVADSKRLLAGAAEAWRDAQCLDHYNHAALERKLGPNLDKLDALDSST